MDEIRAQGNDAYALATNVSKQQDIDQLIDQTIDHYETVDVLVNNAGIMDNFLPAHELDDETWYRVFSVNTIGVM